MCRLRSVWVALQPLASGATKWKLKGGTVALNRHNSPRQPHHVPMNPGCSRYSITPAFFPFDLLRTEHL